MDLEKVYSLNLDIKDKIDYEYMEFVQGDTLNKIIISVLNDNEIVNMENYKVNILLKRPDNVIVKNIPVLKENKILYDLGTTEIEVPGIIKAAVEVYDGLERITTKVFKFTVINSLNTKDKIESITEYPVQENSSYIHNQLVASDAWNINHNLNKKCSVTIVDSADNIVIGDVEYIDNNNIKITFTSAFAGKAYLN